MPLSAVIPVLATGLLPLFNPGMSTQKGAASVWASAYYAYTVAGNGGPIAPAKRDALEAALTNAFNPAHLGAGRGLFISALVSYWAGIAWLFPTGPASFIPSGGSIDTDVADTATPEEQAKALADIIHNLTLLSVRVLVPPLTVIT